jgi:NADPH:quinone reductase-like Zn-dependent oxidoreductase
MPGIFYLMGRIYFGWNKPKPRIPGSEFSGIIEEVGKKVTKFKSGDEVFGYLGQDMGAYAEYLKISEDGVLALKPGNLTHEEAAALPYGSIMALHLLRKMDIKPGQKVLINGASGGIGSAAIQIAKNYGAEVTAVCGTVSIQFVKTLGADKVIDYKKEDFTKNGIMYNLVFDILGKSSFSAIKNSLTDEGTYLRASFKLKQLVQMLSTSRKRKKVKCILAPGSREDLIAARELIEAGKIKSHIDKTFPLEQVADAHRYVEQGLKKGHIVIGV